jgi:N-acetylmuramoyl-L-alanine amidase
MGIHRSELYLPRESDIPMALLELLFISNAADATRLANPETQFLIAQTIANTIAALPPVR